MGFCRDTAQGLDGDLGGSATKHPTCGQLSGQAGAPHVRDKAPAASSSGLVDLATTLSKRAEGRDALFAAVTALARVGIREALDLSFLGSGDVLPEDTIAEVLGDCEVPGGAHVPDLKGRNGGHVDPHVHAPCAICESPFRTCCG